jgi:hypothetical protein
MSDRDIQEFLDGLRAEAPVEDPQGLAAYRLLYEALRQDLPDQLPVTFAQAVSDRLLAPPREAQRQKEPALEWILPLLGLMPIIIFAALQTIPLWLERVSNALRPNNEGAMPDLLTLAAFLGGILLIACLDRVVASPRPRRRTA